MSTIQKNHSRTLTLSYTKSGKLRKKSNVSSVAKENSKASKDALKSTSAIFREACKIRAQQLNTVVSREYIDSHFPFFVKFLDFELSELNKDLANTINPNWVEGVNDSEKYMKVQKSLTVPQKHDLAATYCETYFLESSIVTKEKKPTFKLPNEMEVKEANPEKKAESSDDAQASALIERFISESSDDAKVSAIIERFEMGFITENEKNAQIADLMAVQA